MIATSGCVWNSLKFVGIDVLILTAVLIASFDVPAHLEAVVHLLVLRREFEDVFCDLTLRRIRKYTDDSGTGDGSSNDVLIAADNRGIVCLCPAVLIVP